MKILSVLKARAFAQIELDELAAGGKIRFSDVVAPLVQRFDFVTYPKEAKDFDLLEKGVRFEDGKLGDTHIDALVIYSQAVFLDTLANTDESRRLILEMLDWASTTFGLSFSAEMITRWGSISQLLFATDFPLLKAVSPPLQRLAEKVSSVTGSVFDGLVYEPSSLSIGHDPLKHGSQIANLTIQHRTNIPFSQNRYYSEAPLPTNLHIKFLEEFEKDVLEIATNEGR